MKLRKYILTLKSDSGLMRVQTVGTSARNVITGVLNQQNAPFRALKSIRITPLK